eukprot:CFRG3392T1
MGNSFSSQTESERDICYPNPNNQSLKYQSVVRDGDDWGSGVHRSPDMVDGKPVWRKELVKSDQNCSTLYQNFQNSAKRFPDNVWLGQRSILRESKLGEYEWVTYQEAALIADQLGSGLIKLGVKPRTSIGIYSKNRPEWTITETACNAHSCPTVAVYDTLGPDSVNYVITHSEMVAVFFSKDEMKTMLEICERDSELCNLHLAICYDDNVTDADKHRFSQRNIKLVTFVDLVLLGEVYPAQHSPPTESDRAVIMYTSGTTGSPKGVQITHGNIMASLKSIELSMTITPEDVHISYLPLAHVFERVVQAYCTKYGASFGFYSGNIPDLIYDIQMLKPTFFIAVPRILNRIYDKINEGIKAASMIKQTAFSFAFNARLYALRNGQDTPICNRLVFKKFKGILGGKVRFILSGSAPLDFHIHEFLRVCLCPCIMVGYGLTETTAGLTCTHPSSVSLGHAGGPLPVCEVKLASVSEMNYMTTDVPPRGEVYVRGHNIFLGYLKDPVRSKMDIDEDGWYHTGDVAQWNDDGTLSIIDRMKSIFKLAQGEYVAAEKLESHYGKCPLISQILVYGDSLRTYPLAVVVPDPDAVAAWGVKHRYGDNYEELVKTSELKAKILRSITKLHAECGLNRYELVRDILIEAVQFSPDNGLLTPTLKLRRPVITKKYKETLTALYDQIENKSS